ncbi:MAG: hypothetical protein K8I00_06500, partial [Candidatus Omnitrophica bacterium]|nr:hypothetical protein [Candidatus Omnitrophota bacterium]
KRTIKYLSHIDEDIKKNGVTFSEEDKVKFFRKEYKRMREQEDWAASNQVDTNQVREFTEDRRRREEAAFVYDAALTLYKKDYHRQALEKFYEVQALYPDFKKTQSYIRKLHKKVPGSENQFTRMKKEAGDKAGQLYRPAAGVNEQVVRAVNEEERKKIELAESKYQQAVGFYNERNFTEAQRKFIAVESVVPGYKATRDYLKNIDGDIAKKDVQTAKKKKQRNQKTKDIKSREVQDKSYREKYRQAKADFKSGNYEQAKAVFQEVNGLRPGYRGTEKYLARIDKKMAERPAIVAKDVLRETAKDVSPETDATKRYIAKKVEPIPGMNSGVPKTYPDKLPQPTAVVEAPRIVKEAPRVETSPVKELSKKDLKTLAENRQILDRLREDPEAHGRMTERDREILDQNRREIEKQLAQQEKNARRQLNDVVGETYKEAQDLFKLEQYAAAKAKFTTVEGIKPGYKRAAAYIRQSDEKLIELYREEIPKESNESLAAVAETPRAAQMPPAQNAAVETSSPVRRKETPRKKTVEELAAEIDDDYYHPMSDIEYSRRMLDTTAQQDALTEQARSERRKRLEGAEQK